MMESSGQEKREFVQENSKADSIRDTLQKEVLKMAEDAGFSHMALADRATWHTMKEVRDMCAADKCNAYGHSWTCPPACGTIEECQARMMEYDWGVLVQTTQMLEDSMDYEGMMEGEKTQKERFSDFLKKLREKDIDVLALSSGGCRICRKCSYPDSPCRFPEKAHSSMEAYDLLVSQVCKDNNLGYYYGKDTVTYTGLMLVKEHSGSAK